MKFFNIICYVLLVSFCCTAAPSGDERSQFFQQLSEELYERDPQGLAPEDHQLLEKIAKFCETRQITKETFNLTDLLTPGNKFFTPQSVATTYLPRGKSWKWNQSNSFKRVELKNGEIIFRKLNRKGKKDELEGLAPGKVWTAEISLSSYDSVNFIWIERGPKEEVVSNPKKRKKNARSEESSPKRKKLEPPQAVSAPAVDEQFDLLESADDNVGLEFDPRKLTLELLSFLAQFIDTQTAQELGWEQ